MLAGSTSFVSNRKIAALAGAQSRSCARGREKIDAARNALVMDLAIRHRMPNRGPAHGVLKKQAGNGAMKKPACQPAFDAGGIDARRIGVARVI
jgi:hypothetical protein